MKKFLPLITVILVFIFTSTAFSATTEIAIRAARGYFESPEDKGAYVDFTNRADDYLLKKYIRVQPSAGFYSFSYTYDSQNNRYRISGNFKAGQEYTVELLAGEGSNGKFTCKPSKVTFIAKGAQPKFEFVADRSIIELKSKQLIPVSFTNVGNFKSELTTLPAFFTPVFSPLCMMAEASEQRPNETSDTKYRVREQKQSQITEKNIDGLLANSKTVYNNLKNVSDLPALKAFINNDFNTVSKGYLGSEGSEKEMFFSLPLDYRQNPTNGGSVLIRLSENGNKTASEALRLVQVTDLSITYKFSEKSLLIWVTSIETGAPVANAEVMIYTQDGRRLFPGKTDKDGLLMVKDGTELKGIIVEGANVNTISEKFSVSNSLLAVAATDKDYSFASLIANRIYPANMSQSAVDEVKFSQVRGTVFTERGVYRPGEEIFWKAVFRQYKDYKVNGNINNEAVVVIMNSRGEEIFKKSMKLNEFGSCSGSLVVPSYAPLGQYNIEAFIPQKAENVASCRSAEWDVLMERKNLKTKSEIESSNNNSKEEVENAGYCSAMVQVQEFEAPRHFAEISVTPEKRTINNIVGKTTEQNYIKCSIAGKYYAGGILRHAKVRWSAYLTGKSYKMSEYPGYEFGNDDSERNLIESGDSILNNDGILEIGIPVSQSVVNGLNSIEINATIIDVDGKAATSEKIYTAETNCKVGISDAIGPNENGQNQISVIALDKNNKKLKDGNVTIEVLINKWFYTQKRGKDGQIYYTWTNAWSKIQSQNASFKGSEATFNIPAFNNRYMVKASYFDGKSSSTSAKEFYPSGSFDGYADYNKTYRTSSGNQIVLSPNKRSAKPGEIVKVTFSMPKPASYALITKETNELLSAEVIKIGKGIVEFNTAITNDCRPNVYIGAIIPTLRSEFPLYSGNVDSDYPTTCYGYTYIDVKEAQNAIKVEIEPNNKGQLKALPGETKKLTFKVTDTDNKPANAELAIGVVDESVLALTGYVTPVLNMLSKFASPLAVFTGDLRVSLIAQDLFKLISTRALTGGGSGDGTILTDKNREDFRPVAYWNPAVVTNAEGMAEVEVKFPDTMTSYRIFAVAADKESGFDSKESQIQVSKDFYVEPAAIPYLTAGDKAVIAASLHNGTSKSGNASLKIAQATNITAVLDSESVKMNPEVNSVAKITLEADNDNEKAELTVAGEFEGMKDSIKRVIPITTSYTMVNRLRAGAIHDNHVITEKLPEWVTGELRSAVKAQFSISGNLWPRLEPAFNYMMNYNYGCAEQTSSKLMVLSAVRFLAANGFIANHSAAEIDKNIEKCLNKLYTMQLGSGGFGYWPGSWNESWWATQYAVFALTKLKQAGYPINEERFKQSLNYIKNNIFKAQNKSYFEHGILALAAVNLTMNDMIKDADLTKIKSQFSSKDEEANLLLQFAEVYTNTMPLDSIGAIASKLTPSKKAVIKGWQVSSVRADAIKLMICNMANGASVTKAADNLAGSIMKQLVPRCYIGSTADTGIALLALTDYMKKQIASSEVNAQNVKVQVTTSAGTKELDVDKTGTTFEVTADDMEKGIKLVSVNKTLVNWSLTYSYPDNPADKGGVSNGFIVQKTLENTSGNKEYKVGDIVKATIIFEDKFANDRDWVTMSDLYIEDPIPAGFIAINTSLKNESLPSDISADEERYYYEEKNGSYPFYADYQEMKKDRLTAFRNRAWSGRFRIEYYLRAAYPGTFTVKPTQVGLMYEPDMYGRTEKSTIKINE